MLHTFSRSLPTEKHPARCHQTASSVKSAARAPASLLLNASVHLYTERIPNITVGT
jgi:hypothetical protein